MSTLNLDEWNHIETGLVLGVQLYVWYHTIVPVVLSSSSVHCPEYVCVCVCVFKIHRLLCSDCSHHTTGWWEPTAVRNLQHIHCNNSKSTSSYSHRCVKQKLKITHTHTRTLWSTHSPRKVKQLLLYFCHTQSHQSEDEPNGPMTPSSDLKVDSTVS